MVVPVYNEAESLPALRAALERVLTKLRVPYEIILVDDGSADDTWKVLKAWHKSDARVRAFRFARNFGKEAALSAGIFNSRGDAVVLMDSDLQHPPEIIPRFIEKWREGYDMVYAMRTSREGDSAIRRGATGAFYRLFARIADVDLPPGAGDFRLLDRKVVEILNRMPERLRFMKGLYAWAGCHHVGVPYDPPPRRHGSSAMSMRRLTGFGLDGIVAFSRLPLAISGWIGAAIALVALGLRRLPRAAHADRRRRRAGLRLDHGRHHAARRRTAARARRARRLRWPHLRRDQAAAALHCVRETVCACGRSEPPRLIANWREFWDRPHRIYVNERHRRVHYARVAADIVSELAGDTRGRARLRLR